MIRRQEYDKAARVCEEAIKESTQTEVLADAWLNKANLLFAQKQSGAALMAYLHVPVFFRDARLVLPDALLGSVRAYRRLDDAEHAKKAAQELTAAFPKAPQVALAQAEVQKIQQ
jgi:TolA-binding protein